MATKKELDDMLNNLTGDSKPAKKKKKKPRTTAQDSSDLGDILDVLDSGEKAPAEEPKKKVRTLDPAEKTQVFGNKPTSAFDKKFGRSFYSGD